MKVLMHQLIDKISCKLKGNIMQEKKKIIKRIKNQNEHDIIYNINHKNTESKINNINHQLGEKTNHIYKILNFLHENTN